MKKFSKEEKAVWLEDWRRSGMKAWIYAKENGLNPQTFTKWTKAETENDSHFIEIPVQVMERQFHVQEILIEKGDVKIHIPSSIGCGELRSVMEGLGASL